MPRRKQLKVRDLDLCIFEWGDASQTESSFLLLHATGFHARCWDQVIAAMGGAHVLAVDIRGHGRSDKQPPYDWKTLGRDIVHLLQQLDISNLVGCGHSMGGHLLVAAAAAETARFARLLLLDPVILAEDAYLDQIPAEARPAEHPVARRRSRFASAEEMAARLSSRGGYHLWDPKVLDDYCRHGLLSDGCGGLQLACPPLIEAEIYLGTAGNSLYGLIPGLTMPVAIVRGRERQASDQMMDFSKSPTFPGLAEVFPRGEDIYRPDLSHFIPMQAPDWVAELLLAKDAKS